MLIDFFSTLEMMKDEKVSQLQCFPIHNSRETMKTRASFLISAESRASGALAVEA